MYGWITESVESLVISKYGLDTWKRILCKAGVDIPPGSWIRGEYYPDSIAQSITSAASEVLGVEVDQLLEAHGSYFLHYIKEKGYDNMLRCLGSDLQTWLANVNMLHNHLMTSLPDMVAPSFW